MADHRAAVLMRFLLTHWLGLDGLLMRPRYAGQDRAGIDAVLDLAERFADEMLAGSARAMDLQPPRLGEGGRIDVHESSAEAVRGLATNGFFSMPFDEDRGGLQLPNLIHMAVLGLNMAGDAATASYILLTVGNARLIVEKGTAAQVAAFADPQIAGAATGTMCLSEPHAGSSLGAITTRAVPDGEDALGRRFRLRGAKMGISGADHDATANIVHLVLAKVPGADGTLPDGTRGISLFIVPKVLPDGALNDVAVTGLNHKLGQRALPNGAMAFGDGHHAPGGSAGAIGWLLGAIGQGLSQMFQMMNDARVSVGMGAAMLALRGYHLSLAYARERVQGSIDGRPVAIVEHPDVRRMLLSQKAIAEGALALVLFGARLLDDEQTAPDPAEREAAATLLALLTPAIKSWPAEIGQEALGDAVQVLGGAGYTIDHELEKLYRDNRLNPIHEGTTGIQAIDLVGRKLRRDGGRTFAALTGRIAATVAAARADPALEAAADRIAAAAARLAAAVGRIVEETDERWTLGVATPLLHAFGHVVVAWLWLDQVRVAILLPETERAENAAFHAGRRHALAYFVDHELPRIAQWLHPIEIRSDAVAAMETAGF